jgi:hypothetical protein
MMSKVGLAAWIVLLALPSAGREKKTNGEIPDRNALNQVRTYCVDERELTSSDRYIVDGFLTSENKPKHLLAKLSWKRADGCEDSNVDAIATVEFVGLKSVNVGTGGPTGPVASSTDSRDPESLFKVVLTVNDPDQKLLYRAEAMPLASDEPIAAGEPTEPPRHGGPIERQDAVYHAFWGLIEDLHALGGAATK